LSLLTRVTNFVQIILKEKIKQGNIAIDATMGNGNDTVFLARSVGISGKVYSFDVQEIALRNTKEKITEHHLKGYDIQLINDGHENINQYIEGSVDVVMFNLGYLPKGDPAIITRPKTTIKAISHMIQLLKPGGIISIIIYYGHEGGKEEKEAVLDFLKGIPKEEITVIESNYTNHMNNPPIIVFIEKNK